MPLNIRTKEDLDYLIKSQIPEDYQLDYKAAAKIHDKVGIAKAVSSMANAAGGVIVCGLKEVDKKPGYIDPIPGPMDEYLDEIIGYGIAPPPSYRIHSIQVDGGYVYVVEVDPGQTVHQLKDDKRYHKRVNTTTRAMEDYEIRDVMGRSKNPDVNVRLERVERRILVYLTNTGNVVAKHVRCQLGFPRHFLNDTWSRSLTIDGVEYYLRDVFPSKVIHPASEILITDDIIISPDVYQGLRVATETGDEPLIQWKVWADNAPPKEGQIRIADVKSQWGVI